MRKYHLDINPMDNYMDQSLENNNISIQLLKLAFSGDEEKRAFLVKTECLIFGSIVRKALKQDQIIRLLSKFGIEGQRIEESEWSEDLKNELLSGSCRWDSSSNMTTLRRDDFLKFPFKQAYDLVGRMNTLLRRGIVYIHKNSLADQLVRHFRESLKQQLELFSQHRL